MSISVWQEHRFWVDILLDHAQFVHDNLSPSETKWVNTASQFIVSFQSLSDELSTLHPALPESSGEMIEFAKKVHPVAYNYYRFEGHLQKLRISNDVNLNLSPTYLAGTTDENQEYLRLLSYYTKGQSAPMLSLPQLLDLWLFDQSGHGTLLADVLDPIEISLLKEVRGYVDVFLVDLATNIVLKHYLKFTPPGFPFEKRFIRRVAENVVRFYRFVEETVHRYKQDEALNRTTLRFLEHHFPESCYFLTKLAYYDPGIYAIPHCPIQVHRE
ncbi:MULTISPECIES: DUF2935 domain-containing protein [Alicyclobacillus]|uniref:DUF2935 domain-containing protein n=2 Tax=Alicyclobacillus acidoterrestris TaxID=1450 RepID=T0BQN7_ALIAG|nr:MULTISPECIES: DUF2935 domain-containing protein [Alicyclobacillus]EPZ43029.1 hypothetical protein N007_01430 [Alicyclobacillus acidoterrestris ATCC 49025]UNO49822.1 DUF2935 domain-containing protein [Alicyclobacillus acidoterrestris]